jgi:hypothetical protein
MNVVNRVLAALLALALLIGGLLAATEIVLAQLGRPSWLIAQEQWSAWVRQRTFSEGLTRAILGGLVVLGLLLLLAALRRGKPRTLSLPSAAPGVQVTASRRGIERTLRAAAARTSGVTSVEVKASRRKVKVKAHIAARAAGSTQQQVSDVVASKLDELGLAGTLRPKVRVATGRTR